MQVRGLYLVTGLAIAISAAMVAAGPTPADAQNAKVTALVLDVTHRVGANGSFVKSTIGAQLPPGSRVRTGRRSKCEIKFPSGSVIRVGERSDLVIQQATNVQLGYGRVYAKIIAGTAATVSGTTATAAVKGTEFEFIGISEDEQDLPPNERHEILRVYSGEVFLSNAAGERTLTAGMASQIVGDFEPADPTSTPPAQFPGGQRSQWWGGVRPGLEVAASVGGGVGAEIQQQRLTTTSVDTQIIEPPDEGAVEVVITGLADRSDGWGAGLWQATSSPTAWDPAYDKMLASLPLGSLAAGTAFAGATGQLDGGVDVFGKQFFGPDYALDVFGFWAEGGTYLGALPRLSGVWGEVYLQVSGLLATDFHGDTIEFADTYAAVRPEWGEVVVGRQRFLDGPINNTPVGSLLPFDVADAVRVDYQTDDRLKLTGAYLDDWTPLIGDDTSGTLLRAEYAALGGTVGASWLHRAGAGSEGWTVDAGLPALPGTIDLYAQAGEDPGGRALGTAGGRRPFRGICVARQTAQRLVAAGVPHQR